MLYKKTDVVGAFVIDLEPRGDERGFFSRMFDVDEFAAQGLEGSFCQINTSMSVKALTLRGLHYQVAPAGEAKLIKCVAGSIFDVVVDLRADSPTFTRWFGGVLTAENRSMLYVPKGCAHGFLTLEDNTEVMYPVSAPYSAQHERVLRWNDPAISIEWPAEPVTVSDKDRAARDFDANYHYSGY